jgi:hypothetical protein
MKRFVELSVIILVLSGCQTAPPKPAQGMLHGIVFDLDKAPVSGARIALKREGIVLEAETDNQGRFSIPEISKGEYRLTFSKPMYEQHTWPLQVNDFMDVLYLQTASYWQLLDAGADALGKKQWGEAEEYLNRASTIQEESPTGLFLKAVLEEKRGDPSAAIVDVEAATKLDDKAAYLWLYLADLYEETNVENGEIATVLRLYLDQKNDPSVEEKYKEYVQGK